MRSYTTYYGQADNVEGATSITLADEAAITGADIVVGSDQDAASIGGFVLTYGQPLAGATVMLWYANSCWIGGERPLWQTTSNSDGRFRLDGLPRGSYCLIARDEFDGQASPSVLVDLPANDSARTINVDLYPAEQYIYLPAVAR